MVTTVDVDFFSTWRKSCATITINVVETFWRKIWVCSFPVIIRKLGFLKILHGIPICLRIFFLKKRIFVFSSICVLYQILLLKLSYHILIFLQEMVAVCLGIPRNRIMCHVKRIGGAFGGKMLKTAVLACVVAVASNKYVCICHCSENFLL